MKAKVELGDAVKDSITGFRGVAVAITEWLHGCRRVTIQPDKITKEGKLLEPSTFDEPQVLVLKKRVHLGTADAGGPRPEPERKA